MAKFQQKIEIAELRKGVHCVDLGESFQTRIFLQNFVSIQPRTSPQKFAASCSASSASPPARPALPAAAAAASAADLPEPSPVGRISVGGIVYSFSKSDGVVLLKPYIANRARLF